MELISANKCMFMHFNWNKSLLDIVMNEICLFLGKGDSNLE